MDKVDRPRWAEAITFISYGVRVGVRVNKQGYIDELAKHFPPGWKPSPSPVVERMYSIKIGGRRAGATDGRLHQVYADAETIARVADLRDAIDAFESDLQLYVAEQSPRRVFVHAGVVGWRGKAIVIPGRSFSGKTSLVAALVKAGATYYSDEYAVLDERGRVHHYARPLSIRDIGPHEKPNKYPVETLGGRRGAKPLPVGLILVSKYKPGAQWRPRKLTAGEGALCLLANTVSARRQPENALATLREVVARAPVLKGSRGEASQVVDFVFNSLSD
jgi:hypothetical protein